MDTFNNEASIYVQRMLDFYKILSLSDLSKIINVSPPAITNWRKFNYVNAIRKKCKELGIYHEIFGDDDVKTQTNSISNSTIEGPGIVGFGNSRQTAQKNKKKNELELTCEPLTQIIFSQLCEVFVDDEEELQKILLELLHDKKKQLLSI